MNASPPAGRRRAGRPPLRRDLAGVLSHRTVAKTGAVVGLLAAVGTSMAVAPASSLEASPLAASSTVSSATPAAQARAALVVKASRSNGREALTVIPAETAGRQVAEARDATLIAPLGPVAGARAGLSGVTAKEKPAPKVASAAPAPTATDTVSASGEAAASAAPATPAVDSSSFAGFCAGLGLGTDAANVCSAVRSAFGIANIGGYRAGDTGDHGAGMATDIMVSDFGTGDAVAAFVQANAATFNIKYVIWKQRIWYPGGGWSFMADRGSPTENHMDHVHVSVN